MCDNEFEKMLLPEVIPPNELGVTFDHIGALDNVKETLRELVMLPLQRPELFLKGQLTKVFWNKADIIILNLDFFLPEREELPTCHPSGIYILDFLQMCRV